MANIIKIKYSDTPAAVPTLAAGEIAINRADGILYYANSSNVVTAVSLNVTRLRTPSTRLFNYYNFT